MDPSDIVQQSLLQAIAAREQFAGQTDAELAGWLRQILARNLAMAVRDFSRCKRDVSREQALEALMAKSSAKLGAWLAADQSTPSGKAVRNEDALRLAEALEQLPEAQREALVMQHWQGWTLAKIGEHMGRSKDAVAGLLKRGLKQLREFLQEQDQSND